MPQSSLPTLLCRQAVLPALSANPLGALWNSLSRAALLDTVTGGEPELATNVRAVWNPDELRVLFQSVDSHPWATLTERDAPLYTEEVVEVFLDPVGDLESYYEIEVNPLNAVLDLVVRKNRSGLAKDFRWQCEGLRTAVAVTTEGWSAELSIPFRSVTAAPPQPGDRWRVNFCRIDRPAGRERELSAWSPTGAAQFHRPERFGFLEFRPGF